MRTCLALLTLALFSCSDKVDPPADGTAEADADTDADTDADADADADSDTDADSDSDTDTDADADADADSDADTDADSDADTDPNACSNTNPCVVYACYCGECDPAVDIQCVTQSWANANECALMCPVAECPEIDTTVCSCDTPTGLCVKS